MATATASPISSLPEARVTPPDLYDSNQYVRIERVPLLDPHVRKVMRGGKAVEEEVDPKQLAVIARNSQARCDAGDYGLVFIGHTNPDKRFPEIKQPPLVGYVANYQLGQRNGAPVILGDLFVERQHAELVRQFPRRSIEIFGKNDPDGYIDAVALLRRAPERDLGIVTYDSSECPDIYLCDSCQSRMETPMDVDNIPEPLMDAIADKVVDRLLSIFEQAGGDQPGDDQPSDEGVDEVPGPSGLSGPDDMDQEQLAATAAATPSGTNTFVPGDRPRDQYQRELETAVDRAVRRVERQYQGQIHSLRTTVSSLQQDAAESRQQAVLERRRRELFELQQDEGYVFNLDKQVERLAKLPEDQYQAEVDNIRENYARTPVGQEMIPTAEPRRRANAEEDAILTQEEIQGRAVEAFAKAHPELDRNNPVAILTAYFKDRKDRRTAGK